MRIQNNIASINTSRNQGLVKGKMNKTLEKLSSGYRINRAGDDAAGLAISELMRSQIAGLDQAIRNNNDGISMTNTGEGALQEIHSMLQRMKTLAIEAANGIYDSTARTNVDMERQELLEEIDRISQSTDFAGIPLFGTFGSKPMPTNYTPPEIEDNIELQIGYTSDEVMDLGRYYMGSKELLLDKVSFHSRESANAAVDTIEKAISAVTEVRSSFGAAYNHLEHTNNNLGVTKENMTAAESGIRDTNMAEYITEFTKENIMLQASNAMLSQANNLPDFALQLLR